MILVPQRRSTDTPGHRAQHAFTAAHDQALELAADIIAHQATELARLRREVVILTGRWEKTA